MQPAQSPCIYELDTVRSSRVLERLTSWRSGICPNGKLAPQPCFVLKRRPIIFIHPDRTHTSLQYNRVTTAQIITEWEWAFNLVKHCGSITQLNDDSMLKIMAHFFMIFHASSDSSNDTNTLHLLQLHKHASFKTDQVLRPTQALQQKLDKVFAEDRNPTIQWLALLDLWDSFGYLWPRKIILGYRTHVFETYKCQYGMDSVNAYYHHMNALKEQMYTAMLPDDKLALTNLDEFLNNCCIISRQDLAPLHEFLAPNYRQAIQAIIDRKFVRVPLCHPIKLYNVLTNSYLCWDPALYQRQTDDLYNIRGISGAVTMSLKSSETQYLWRFCDTIAAINTASYEIEAKEGHERHAHVYTQNSRQNTIRGASQVYIQPACKSLSPAISYRKSKSPDRKRIAEANENNTFLSTWTVKDRFQKEDGFIDTHKMILSCRSYSSKEDNTNQLVANRNFTKLRGLRLLFPVASAQNYSEVEQCGWTVQYPNNSLKYTTNAQSNIRINFHEHIRRMKPVLIGDTIQLQQVGLLTVFDPITKTDTVKHHASLRSAKRIGVNGSNSRSRHSVRAISNGKKNVFCVDEDITSERFVENTFWRIELATEFDQKRHSSNIYQYSSSIEITSTEERQICVYSTEQQASPITAYCWSPDTESVISTRASTKSITLRRTKSLGSIQNKLSSVHAIADSDKAHYFEDLVAGRQKSKYRMLSQFVKRVTLQPLTQFIVKPTKASSKSPHSITNTQLSPPPFLRQKP